jgi:hypothetical protein
LQGRQIIPFRRNYTILIEHDDVVRIDTYNTYKFAHASAADPAPETTIFVCSTSFPASSSAFKSAADEMIAVPLIIMHDWNI